ncbi:MAG: hypothetical protein PHR66_04460 [Desulfuromonadaceae bacterium]|nr:hypothetical protein [Desulfuromonadaceae bacterium]
MKNISSAVTVILAALSFTAAAFAADAVKPVVPAIDTTAVSSTAAGIQKDSKAAKEKVQSKKAKAKADATAKAKAAKEAKAKAKADAAAKAKAAKEAKAKAKSDAAAKAKETKEKAKADANAIKNSFVPPAK